MFLCNLKIKKHCLFVTVVVVISVMKFINFVYKERKGVAARSNEIVIDVPLILFLSLTRIRT